MRAVALLSSGLDSSLALALAKEAGHSFAFALTFDYGQRAAARELDRAQRIATHFGVPHRVIALPFFRELKGRGLLSQDERLPHPTAQDLDSRAKCLESAKAVWVPNRNGVFLEVAAAIAESEGAQQIVVGFNAEEAVTFPDNSDEYREAINRALAFSTANGVAVISPTAHLNKREIAQQAVRLRFPLELLWSCYEAGEKMCGECESCMRLKRALEWNQVKLGGAFANPSL